MQHWLLLIFFFKDTAPTEIYTLSLHDALPISGNRMPILRQESFEAGVVHVCGARQRRDEIGGDAGLPERAVQQSRYVRDELRRRADAFLCQPVIRFRRPAALLPQLRERSLWPFRGRCAASHRARRTRRRLLR